MPDAEVPKEKGPFKTPDGQEYKTWGRFVSYLKDKFPGLDPYTVAGIEPDQTASSSETPAAPSSSDDKALADMLALEKGKEIMPLDAKKRELRSKVITFEQFRDSFIAIPELINEILNWIEPDSEYYVFAEIWTITDEEFTADMKLIYKIILVAKPELLIDMDTDGITGIILCMIPVLQIYAKKVRMTIKVIALNKKVEDQEQQLEILEGDNGTEKKNARNKKSDRSRKRP